MSADKQKAKKRATVIDVARLAGVGGSTVSRYLRGVPVKPKVAERVAAAIQELNYFPDEMARSLRVGRTRTIGAILPKISNVFFSQAAQVMEEEVRARGCTLIVLTHQDSLQQQLTHLNTLRRYRADGVILAAAPGSDPKLVQESLPGVPVVSFDSFLSPAFDSVLLKNREAGRLATEHLLQHGYRDIACLTARPEVYSFRERIAGYREAMEAKKLKPYLITAPDYERLRYELGAALQGKHVPAAILSLSDFSTAHLLMTMDEIGMAQEKRLPFISFDDFRFAPFVNPPVTLIRQPIDHMVRYALYLMFARVDGAAPEQVQAITLPGELVLRQSCGCR